MVRGDPGGRRGLRAAGASAPRGLVRRRHHAGRSAALIAAVALALSASDARADELDDFTAARDAYVNGEYPRAIRDLRELLERSDSPQLAVVRPSARKYLAASLYSAHREAEARIVIADLLREEPRARLDGTSFEVGFARLFDDVVRSMETELDRIIVERAQGRRAEENLRDARRAAALDLLSHESGFERVPRWQTFVPFGVGQFANRQVGLGFVFLSLETVFLAGSIASAVVDQQVQSPTQPAGVFEPADDQRANVAFAMRVVNWSMLGAFVVTSAIGIWRANADYAPLRPLPRTPRALPPVLQGIQISAQPGAVGASLRLAF
jgi:hypothetical protein